MGKVIAIRGRRPKPRELYRLTLRDKPEGYCCGEVGANKAYTSKCKVCGGIGLRLLLDRHGYVVLHEIRFVERLTHAGRNAWGSIVLDVADACGGGKRKKTVNVVMKEGMGL